MQAFAHLGKMYGPRSHKQLKSEDYIILLRAEAYNTLSIIEQT